MKLKLKHVQHYPIGKNGIKILLERTVNDVHLGYNSVKRGSITHIEGMLYNGTIFVHSEFFKTNIKFIKPILHPLSNLTKPIKVEGYNEGKDFVPMEKFDIRIKQQFYSFKKTGDITYKNWYLFPYEFVEKLFEWHFDVFGLIPAGLAIDINTLNK